MAMSIHICCYSAVYFWMIVTYISILYIPTQSDLRIVQLYTLFVQFNHPYAVSFISNITYTLTIYLTSAYAKYRVNV